MKDNSENTDKDDNEKYVSDLDAANKAIEKNNNNKDAWLSKSQSLFYLKRYEESFEAFDKATDIDPKFKEAWYNKGVAFGHLKRYEESFKAFDKATNIDPKFKEAWFNKGLAFGNLKRYQDSIKAFDWATYIDPKFKEAWFNKGAAFEKLKRFQESIQAFDRATDIDPKFKEAWFSKGLAFGNLKRYQDSIKAFDKATDIDPEFKEAWFNKGLAFSEFGKYKDSVEAFELTIKLDNEAKEAWYNKGVAFGNLKRYQDSIKAFDGATDIDPKFKEAWYNKGVAFEHLKRYEEAFKVFDKATVIDPEFKEALYSKGLALGKLKQYEEAYEVYNKTLNLDITIPEYIELKFYQGQILYVLKKGWEANKCFSEALTKCNSYLWRNKNNDYFLKLKGQILIGLGKYKEATSCLKRAIKTGKKNDSIRSSYYWSLANVYLYRGKYNKAIKLCKEAIVKEPDNINAWLVRAGALYKRGRYNELAEVEYCLKQVTEQVGDLARAFSFLSELYFDLGNMVKAVDMADKALKCDLDLVPPLIVKAKVLVEKKLYNKALKLLNDANSVKSGDIRVQLWELYVHYLQLTYKKDNDEGQKGESDFEYKEELGSIIRKLERLNALAAKFETSASKRLQGELFYLLANFYIKNDDIYSAKDRLESCLKVAKGELRKSARELLSNIWNRLIKPKWWSWWLNSPVYRWRKRGIFSIIFTILVLMFGTSALAPSILFKVNLLTTQLLKVTLQLMKPSNPIIIFIGSFLTFLLIMPSINSFKAKDFEIELHNLSSYDPTLSPISIEETIKSLAPKLPESPLYSMQKLKLDEKLKTRGEVFFSTKIKH